MNMKSTAAWILLAASALLQGCQEPSPGGNSAVAAAIEAREAEAREAAAREREAAAPGNTAAPEAVVSDGAADHPEHPVHTGRVDTSQTFQGAEAHIPADFPVDVPQYPKQMLIMTAVDPPFESYMIQARSSDSVETVKAWYEKELAAAGWTEEAGKKGILAGGMRYSKGGRVLNVRMTPDDLGAAILLTTSKKTTP